MQSHRETEVHTKAHRAGAITSIFDQLFYAVLGQILLPIPVIGALVGWIASSFLPGPGTLFGHLYLGKIAIDSANAEMREMKDRLREAQEEIDRLRLDSERYR